MSDVEVRKAIDAANAGFAAAMNAGDIDKACAVYVDDARLLPPDSPMVSGRPAIAGFWKAAVPALGLKHVTLKTIELTVAGNTAHEIGEAALSLPSGVATIKYVVVWQKQSDDQWRWAVDIWNNGAVA